MEKFNGRMCPVSIDDAETAFDYQPEVSGSSSFVYGVEQFKESAKESVPQVGGVVGGLLHKAGKEIDKYFPDGIKLFNGSVDVKIADKLKKGGEILVNAADRNVEAMQREFRRSNPRLEKAQENFMFDIGNQGANWTTMLLSGRYAGYVMGNLVLGGEFQERADKYKQEHGGSLEGFAQEYGDEAGYNLANAFVQGVEERYLGSFAQVKSIKKGMGFVKAIGKNAVQEGFIEEPLQDVTDFYFDKLTGFNENEELKDRLKGNLRGYVVASLFGGAGGFGAAVYQRAEGIDYYKEALKNTVPEKDLEKVATKAYEQDAKTLREIVTVEIENSSSLENKRGEVYENMYKSAIDSVNRAKKQGGYTDLRTEEEVAAYAKAESDNFANWVLEEANRRNTTIQNVLDASSIYSDETGLHIGMTRDTVSAQIKSTFNRGTYSESKNIYYQEDIRPDYNKIYESEEYKKISDTAQKVADKLGLSVKTVSINRNGGISAYINTPYGDIRISDHDTNYFVGVLNSLSQDVDKIVNEYKKIESIRKTTEDKQKYFNDIVAQIKNKYTNKQIKEISQNDVLATIINKPYSGYLSSTKFYGKDAEIIEKWRNSDVSILYPFMENLDNIYYQFAGEKAQTAALDNLRLAQNMEINDYSTDEIWRETGWYKGKDGKWRFEISDDDAVVDLSKTATDAWTTLGNILSHDKLYSAYPELRGLSVIVSSEMKGGLAGAHYLKGVYDKDLGITIGKRIEINSDIMHRKDADLKSIIMHEVQHAIQDIEGFASGGSVSTFFDKENMDVFQKLFQEEDNKKFNQAVVDALYEEVSTDAANKIFDADDKVIVAAEKFELAEGDGIEEAQVYDDALEELDNALKEAGKSSDWFAELKTKAREKAGLDIMGRSKRAKNYDPFELYKQLYGEVEARNTQSRMDLTEKERRAKTPESTQDVKNADAIVIFDDGTAMAYKPEAYYQDDDRDLVVLHSISPANLRKSIDFGGFAVPSLAIVRKGQEFHFDNLPITLVGNKQMIDPYDERNEVYNRDVWTKTFPYVTYKKPTQAKEKSFKNKIGEYYKRTNSENELGSFIYVAQRGDTSSALSQFQSSSGAMLYYLENIKKQKVEFTEKDLASDILERAGIDETLANEIQGLDVDKDRDKITKAFKRFLEIKEEKEFSDIKDAEKREKMIKFSRKLANENYFDKEGNLYFAKADTIVTASDRYFSSKGKKFIDQYEVRRQLRDMIENDENYREWATEFFEKELVGDKMVRIGNALKPFTLENVVEAMTTGATVASQETPLPAMGKVIAAGAKRLESIRDIKEEGKKLVTLEQSKENMEKVKEALYDFLNMFEKGDDFSRNMDRKDAVATALQGVLKNKNITKESLKKAILRQLPSDKSVSDEALSYGIELAKKIKELARYYFEAKPQRAVGLNDFSAAIIPTDAQFDEIANFVSSKGLYVVRSDNQQESLQNIDVNKNVFFQKKRGSIQFKGQEAIIRLTESANASTLAHELAHYYLQNTFLYSKSGLASNEYSTYFKPIADYLGIDSNQETIKDWQQEKFARAYEQYLLKGKAETPELQAAFNNYNKWIKRAYRMLKSKPKYRNEEGKLVEPRLTPEIMEAFGKLTGGFVARPDIEAMAETVTPELENAVVEYENKVTQEQERIQKETVYPTTEIRETAEEGTTGKSGVAFRVLGEELGYDVKHIKDQMEKAREFVRKNLSEAKEIVNGKQVPDGMLSSAINLAYVEIMENSGNYQEAERATRIRSMEQTRRGQEIAMEKATTDNILNAETWSNLVLSRKSAEAARKYFKNDLKALQDFIKRESANIAKQIVNKPKEERAAIIKENLERITQETGILFQEDYSDLEDSDYYNEVLNETQLMIEKSMGIGLDEDQIDYIHDNVRQLQDIVNETVSNNGNISIEAFKQIRKMYDTIESYTPSSNVAVWSSIIGRGAMLASVKSPILNIISNAENMITETLSRKVLNIVTGQSNDNIVDSNIINDYLKWSYNVYQASGYMPSVTSDILGGRPILGEKRLTSQGQGKVRAIGRFAEDIVFKELMGLPDSISKDLNFVSVAGNKATQQAYKEGLSGDKAKARANELFKDAILLRPMTEEGERIRNESMKAAHEATFTQDSEISKIALRIRDVLNSKEFKAGDFLVPFVKTPANVVALGMEYSLGTIYTVYHIKDIINNPQSDVSQAAIKAGVRNGIGMILAMMLAGLVDDDDYIPEYDNASPKQRDIAKLKNAPFNSIRIGNKWINLDYFGPLAIPMAGILTARAKQDLTGFLQGVSGQALKTPGVKEINSLIGDVTRAVQYGVSYKKIAEDVFNWGVEQTASRTIPAIITDFGKLIDKYERETGGEMVRRVMAKIPVLREELPIKTDITGRKIETEPTNILFGSRVKTAVDDAVVKEIDRLNKAGNAPTISDPTRYGKFRSLETEDKDKIRTKFNQEYGRKAREKIASSAYKRLDDAQKKKELNKIRKKISDDLKKQK